MGKAGTGRATTWRNTTGNATAWKGFQEALQGEGRRSREEAADLA